MNRKTTNIPVQLIAFCIGENALPALRLYIYLKMRCDGTLIIDSKLCDHYMGIVGMKSMKTLNTHLKKLLELNLIGYDSASTVYFIRGYERVRRDKKLMSRTAVEFSISDIENFRAFSAGALIAYLSNQTKCAMRRLERKKGRSKPGLRVDHFEVSSSRISKFIGVAVSTSFELKKLAAKHGFISLRKQTTPIKINPVLRKMFIKWNPRIGHRVRHIGFNVVLQESDLVRSNLRFCSRKKIETDI
ncbi:MAG: hypothetical protein ACKOXB_08850 [Flavobacteriales bacterium]